MAEKSAALLHSTVGNHGFIDGNKRTAWILVEILIVRSGFRLAISDEEPIDDLVVGVASGDIDFESLKLWFEERLERL